MFVEYYNLVVDGFHVWLDRFPKSMIICKSVSKLWKNDSGNTPGKSKLWSAYLILQVVYVTVSWWSIQSRKGDWFKGVCVCSWLFFLCVYDRLATCPGCTLPHRSLHGPAWPCKDKWLKAMNGYWIYLFCVIPDHICKLLRKHISSGFFVETFYFQQLSKCPARETFEEETINRRKCSKRVVHSFWTTKRMMSL